LNQTAFFTLEAKEDLRNARDWYEGEREGLGFKFVDEVKIAIQRIESTGSTDGYVRLWKSETGKLIWESSHGSEINNLAFSKDGKFVASAGEDGIASIWDTETGKRLRNLAGHKLEIMGIAFSPDGTKIATASLDNKARVWNTMTGEPLLNHSHHGEVLDIAFSFQLPPNSAWHRPKRHFRISTR
jgi:WD40 repeat protein